MAPPGNLELQGKSLKRKTGSRAGASSGRQDGLLPHLQIEFVYAYSSCRQKYINKKYIEIIKKKQNQTSPSLPKEKLRASNNFSDFDWKNNCFICGQKADKAKETKLNKDGRRQILYVNTPTLNDSILDFVIVQKNDYCREIHKRISDTAIEQIYVDESISKSLRFLLSEIILEDKKNKAEIIPNYEKKRKSIARSIISAARP
ncbi:hypothetical protein ILUMI_25178 [Ignelater luminosus]|uniref:Uncharacterized protein n=1 Tax=Ignelater luminosus TaxID=2038154 RepID=A0A8K0FY30_IGNLU|nr:hypothetical protein ILUMI_25178 [Ignelater luminosus]